MDPAATRQTSPLVMLLASAAGMALGFAIDCRTVGPETLVSLCREVPVSFVASAAHHWDLLPATLLGMMAGGILGSLVAGASRFGSALLCNPAMVAGMLLGGWLGPVVAAFLGVDWGPVAMFAAMALGMAGGLALFTIGSVIARSGSDEAIQGIQVKAGLLRFARNDG